MLRAWCRRLYPDQPSERCVPWDSWLERFPDQRFSMTDAVTFEIMRTQRVSLVVAFDRDCLTTGYELMGENL